MDSELERKMREVIDRNEIWQVMQRYGRGLDRIDRELARSCYWEDAIEDHGAFVGVPEDFIDWADMTTLAFANTHHNVMNHYCELDGDNAYAETYYLFMGVSETPPHFMSMGRYCDHFQKRNGEWRIANRVTMIEKNFDIPDDVVWSQRNQFERRGDEAPFTRDRNDPSYQRPPRPRQPFAKQVVSREGAKARS